MTNEFLSHASLSSLIAELVATGTRVIAPVQTEDSPDRLEYKPVCSLADAALAAGQPRLSLKELFLPSTEVLLSYRQTKEGVEIREVPTQARPQVILGALPCDAAALEIVDKVMSWDSKDELWLGRREATTIVSILCPVEDSNCFCTAVGVGPDSVRGSDVFLTPVEGGYLAEACTLKGQSLLEGRTADHADPEAIAEAEKAQSAARKKVQENAPAIPAGFSAWLTENFGHPVWNTMALRCHGCGACASVCPTCHCFDIVDEHENATEGVRRRNWDSCQTAKFTLHSSGHNPRPSQSERFRQRIEHKFSVYPRRFGEMLCTGCGRCSRICPGGMNLVEIVGGLISLSASNSGGAGQ